MIDSVAVGNAPLLQVAQEDERRTAQGQTKRRALQKKKKMKFHRTQVMLVARYTQNPTY